MKIMNHLIGTVGSDPRTGTLGDGRPFAGFRMAVNHEFYNPETGKYQEADTSWFDVSVYGSMAQSVGCSVSKGDPIVVLGRLRVRDWESQDKSGTSAEIIADAIGHNLRFGTGSFKRYGRKRAAEDIDEHAGEADRPQFAWGGGTGGGTAAGAGAADGGDYGQEYLGEGEPTDQPHAVPPSFAAADESPAHAGADEEPAFAAADAGGTDAPF